MTKRIYTDKKGERAWIRGPYKTKTGRDRGGKRVTIIVPGQPRQRREGTQR
jgi:NAD(P)H-flavin reductase